MKFGKYDVDERQHPVAKEGGGTGVQCLIFFPNGYGASIVRFRINTPFSTMPVGSYGIEHGFWELAILKGDESDWSLTYDTPISEDVIGHLNEDEVAEYLEQIESLDVHSIESNTKRDEK